MQAETIATKKLVTAKASPLLSFRRVILAFALACAAFLPTSCEINPKELPVQEIVISKAKVQQFTPIAVKFSFSSLGGGGLGAGAFSDPEGKVRLDVKTLFSIAGKTVSSADPSGLDVTEPFIETGLILNIDTNTIFYTTESTMGVPYVAHKRRFATSSIEITYN